MKVALVHDYLADYGGAERVLEVLCELYPEAPIYTAFSIKGSAAEQRFKNKRIIQSWAAKIPGFKTKLHSPLRFLAPAIWRLFDFSGYDVVISSSSWYITKGIRVPKTTLHVSYIHTPPRYLYGYDTSWNWKKHWPVRVYAGIVNKALRQFDYDSAQEIDVLVANSKEVQSRITKFWRRESKVIYPPVNILNQGDHTGSPLHKDYYLTGGRLVTPKHFDLAIMAANKLKLPLKVFGAGVEEKGLRNLSGSTVEFLGRVSEEELVNLYRGAEAFIVLAEDEDFGITPVEAMMVGTPVIAYSGGGYLESVIPGETGIFIEKLTVEAVVEGIKELEGQITNFKSQKILEYAKRFSKERFMREIRELVEKGVEEKRAGK